MGASSLYVHIPFCERKCLYCDFYSVESLASVDPFLSALRAEISLYAEKGRGARFGTVFFGGGTPSLLTPEQLGEVLSRLHKTFKILPEAEITLETNPGTVTMEKLAAYRQLGVNRLSIGVQSFDDEDLRFLSRIHDGNQASTCVALARGAGFDNISMDLIFALPGRGLESWRSTLERAVELQPEHISAYSLIVEDGTPLARLVRNKLVSPAPVEEEARQYEWTMKFLADHGYEQYEISNYARPGYRSQHNFNYWAHVNYLGFGPSAHSFWNNGIAASRWANVANISSYVAALHNQHVPLAMQEVVTPRDQVNERIFLGLRSVGLDTGALQNDLGFVFEPGQRAMMDELVADGRARWEGPVFRLTSQGYLLCDEIAGRLLV